MLTDALATFADNVALNTGAAGSYLLGDVMDLGAARDIIDTDDLYFVCTVDTTATSGGSATLQVNIITDDNSAMASPAVIASSAAIPVASLTQGKLIIAVALPKGAAYERYLGIQQVTGTAAFTAGKINAFLTYSAVQTWTAIRDALTKL